VSVERDELRTQLANRFGRPGVFFEAATVNELIGNDQDLFVLLSFLHANNGADSQFVAAGCAYSAG
jgi:hypothetical protein